MPDRQTDPYGYALEMQRRREEWEQERRERKAQQEREEKQGALEKYLQRRAREWEKSTGTEPPFDELKRWQQQYLDNQENEYQRERQKKLDRAIQENYRF